MEKIVEVDPSGVLVLLDESGGGRHIQGLQRVLNDESTLSGDMDRVLRSELQHSSCDSKRLVSIEFDVDMLGGPPSKSGMFDIESGSKTRELSGRNLPGMSVVGHSVPSTSQHIGQITAPLSWRLLHEKRLMNQLGRSFHCLLERKLSLVMELVG